MNDFDFLIGSWDSTQRRLRTWLVGSDDWEVFPAHAVCYRMFDGAANVDEVTFPTLGRSGMSVRLFDPAADRWSIYWASTSLPGVLGPPVTGRFVDGVGEFFGDDEHEGRPVRVRYRWSEITDVSARWEQAFSADQGRTWETNWIMELTRRATAR
ncbi:hypothetical protein [Actinophytocola sp.]|uniref:hypothetical protein n=1 Tax=Actinophytocola sp. TaxID=1872138 RepID=UPI002ED10596